MSFEQQAAARHGGMPGVTLQCREGRPFAKRMHRTQQDPMAETYHLLIALFADDATLVTRDSRAQDIEALAVDTLRSRGEKVHPGKTERMVLRGGPACRL